VTPGRRGPRDGDGLAAFLGLRWDDPETVRLEVRPEFLNSAGLLLGPIGFALVDYGMAALVFDGLAEDESMATTGTAIDYVGTVREGEIVCRTTVRHRDARAVVLSGEVRDAEGRLLATAVGRFTILRFRV